MSPRLSASNGIVTCAFVRAASFGHWLDEPSVQSAAGSRNHPSPTESLAAARMIRSTIVRTKERAMGLLRVQVSVLGLGAAVLLANSNIDIRAHAQAAA